MFIIFSFLFYFCLFLICFSVCPSSDKTILNRNPDKTCQGFEKISVKRAFEIFAIDGIGICIDFTLVLWYNDSQQDERKGQKIRMAKVSVIITAFNVEKYIADAVNSVVAQTLKDIEILVVDDCSTDGTYPLLCELAKLDARIHIVRHEQNQSVMIARKHGVACAQGEYRMFLDGDDMLTPDACEIAYRAITEEAVDLLQFDQE